MSEYIKKDMAIKYVFFFYMQSSSVSYFLKIWQDKIKYHEVI